MRKPKRSGLLALFGAVLLVLSAPGVRAQWTPNGTALCKATGSQYRPRIVSDGAGGAIVTWSDWRSGSESDICAQRVDAFGVVQWPTNGVPLCAATGLQRWPEIVSDGAGGAIVTWEDWRNGFTIDEIYAQRVDASGSGVVQWPMNGVPLCTTTNEQLGKPQIASDGAGGAIVTWWDRRNGSLNDDIYAQRVNASGVVQWPTNGVPLCAATGLQRWPEIVSDGAGGAIVTWQDERNGSSNDDIYAQRVDASGVVQWPTNGVPLCTITGDQFNPKIASDGAGGAIVTWSDSRSGGDPDLYAQRVNASGAVQWITGGVPLCIAPLSQGVQGITSDGAGGAIVTWSDSRSGGDPDPYAQRVNASGVVQWPTNGVVLCMGMSSQYNMTIAPDGSGGAIVTWEDSRGVDPLDIFAQRVDAYGVVQWPMNGVPLCIATGEQQWPQIVSDGAGGAIVTWEDWRSGISDIYAQRVDHEGKTEIYLVPVSIMAILGMALTIGSLGVRRLGRGGSTPA